MQTYIILRRNGFASPAYLRQAGERSTKAGEEIAGDIRWLRSYALDEGTGMGTVCVYQATSPEAIRRHAESADLPCDEIIPVADTVVVHEDPQPATT